MPCSKYKSKKQKALCVVTKEWKDWDYKPQEYVKTLTKLGTKKK